MAGNQVTLTFAGDSTQLEKAFKNVGSAADGMKRQLATTEASFDSLGRESGKLGESLDHASGAFSQLSGGIGDVGGAMTAFTDLQDQAASAADRQAAAQLNVEKAQRDLASAIKEFGANSIEAREAQLALNQAQRDAVPPGNLEQWGTKLELISPIIMGIVGATDLLILANNALNLSMIRSTATMIASKVAMVATAVASGVWTAAQWLLNIALTANPIGIIIVAIGALIAIIVLIATKTTWFQSIWAAVWDFLKMIGAWFAGPFADFFVSAWNKITGAFQAAWDWVKNLFIGIVTWEKSWIDRFMAGFHAIPGALKAAFDKVTGFITAPFRAAFNFVSDAWNNTVGRLHWSVPSWVPVVGGNSISAPRLPKFHSGGVVPGAPGSEMLAVLQAGETVIPTGGGGGTIVLELRSDGSRYGDFLIEELKRSIGRRGGDPVRVLGNSRG